MSSLTLRVPAVAEQVVPGVELRPVYTEEWIERLPTANPESLADELGRALAKLRRSPMKPDLRIRLLELYLRPYASLWARIREQRPANDPTTFARQVKETELARAVATELAFGYKLALADAVEKSRAPNRDRLVGTSAQRAATTLSHTLFLSHHNYLSSPAHVYTELMEIFRFAHTHNIQKRPFVRDRRNRLGADFGGTIEASVVAALLLGCADPKRMPPGATWSLLDATQAEPLHILSPFDGQKAEPGVFHVNPDADERPAPLGDRDGHGGAWETAAHHWVLDSRAAVRTLDRLREQLIRDEPTLDHAERARAIENLITAFTDQPVRRDKRTAIPGQVSLLNGLDHIHAQILASDDPGQSTNEANHTQVQSWELVNRGRRGISVRRRNSPESLIGVGDLLGLRPTNNTSDPWRVGMVRWMTVGEQMEHQVGIEWLAAEAQPVTVTAEGTNHGGLPGL
ncbi:MAG: hypothetical protein K0U93_03420, partial [Gammaproteobacteria bacterium]|nr:hypothetical protein [Gammaproteobacteria bacterium]